MAKRKTKSERVNVHDAKTNLSRLIERVEGGESIIICRAGRPVAKLTGMNGEQQVDRKAMFGAWKGKVWYSDDAFDPLSEEELKLWYDAPLVSDPLPPASPTGLRPKRPKREGRR